MNLFERLARSRPAEAAVNQPPKEPAQRMLDFLGRWPEDIVTVRDLRVWGPRIFRNPKDAISSAETLVKYGWLKPTKPHWPGTFAWEIVRKNIARPLVDM